MDFFQRTVRRVRFTSSGKQVPASVKRVFDEMKELRHDLDGKISRYFTQTVDSSNALSPRQFCIAATSLRDKWSLFLMKLVCNKLSIAFF